MNCTEIHNLERRTWSPSLDKSTVPSDEFVQGPGVLLIYDKADTLWMSVPTRSIRETLEQIIAYPGHTLRAGFRRFAFEQCSNESEAKRVSQLVIDRCHPLGQS